ncbi:maleylpyruvate isomerase family mycothiol-dependent enzyme [Nocardioides sp. B-3]|uniref:maleylpyruvate isomerase family mycothiol-dependent enzyme n=1 Tax=Nocardioides sp. B-3 TaxID=2895565 RepID=UPI002152ECFD|nr:maleylpyruvate isomerase family mycothiol-dependent enzyme [Nocardioides sp. B-3]UUZ61252.1 maleylpyruvate isomerase family mycothiol-dependent enzyme [Nocardioides sp. B-3]
MGRRAMSETLAAFEGGKMPWFGPPMSPTSMATARLMETRAHSLDVHAALGVTPEPTDRIRHIAHLAVRTRNFSFVTRDLTPPGAEFRIDLVSPGGDVWAFGPEDAEQTVTGSALDLCLLATQRINRADTDLVATGADADTWLDIAQCFAGPPGEGRSKA